MRRRVLISFVFLMLAVVCAIMLRWRSLSYIHGAPEDQSALWVAALKHFEGPVYYIGSEGDYSYFRAGELVYTRYKARTSKLVLPRTFPFGKGAPYLVTQDMVYLHQ